MRKIINYFKQLFLKKKSEDNFLGYWGVMDSETQESKICGEMYSVNGDWIAGPKIKD